MPQSPLLFLDFDGVLHPAGCPSSERFMHVPRFEQVMRDHPDVRIDISSSWQEAYSIRQLQALFSASIATRVIGGTHGADPKHEAENRHAQILKFLAQFGRTAAWLGLDDTAEEFPPTCPQLVLCDSARGLDDEAETALRLKLLAIRRHTTRA